MLMITVGTFGQHREEPVASVRMRLQRAARDVPGATCRREPSAPAGAAGMGAGESNQVPIPSNLKSVLLHLVESVDHGENMQSLLRGLALESSKAAMPDDAVVADRHCAQSCQHVRPLSRRQ
jgi:hypothetical protein